MLKDLLDQSLITLNIIASDWEDAVRKASQPLVDNGKVEQSYIEDMVAGVKQYGPYIVLTKHVALPHARPESGAKQCALGVATLAHPVEFGNAENDPVKYLFPLAATDNSSHLSALADLAELFDDKDFFEMLDNATSASQVIDYLNKRN